MEINEARGEFGVCPEDLCPAGLIDLPNVLTHEMGHYFGIGHTPHDPEATMWISAMPDETHKRDLQPDDVEAMCSIYPPGSLPDECDPAPRGGLELDCGPGPSCGCRAPGTGGEHPGAIAIGLAMLAIVTVRQRR